MQGQFTVPLTELREAWTGTFPKLFGHSLSGADV